ncbi:MAG: RNB domain-containing ribonuclease [Deltaproteobacteria bacterium]|nr:RNB domain-containing ribonuclease [Deltaproteobacteria bacterium]MBW1931674.1 RNB domain-containing ribonuclease [Deltaproteobacteria bacterium]MBW1937151.1 RNB domain-containing ribonuclease [Deltaproteobacteria bacterium]MBW1964177.1 RNB domain-containing ribonuclease [Deltaproteobacteria bacterium]MBW2080217.1 RNB domain-containing ribonuclease [Deltaproteobacteria bacterium]
MKISTSQVVEFLEGQRFICAQCIAKKGTRYHLLTHLGREINLASSRFIHVSARQLSAKARDIRVKKLHEIYASREALKEKINIPELWELVQDEQALWPPGKLAELAFDQTVVGPDHEAAFIRAVIDDHTYFKFREGMIKVQSPEAVKRILDQRAREAERFARLIRGSQWLEDLWSDNSLKKTGAIKELDDPDISFWISNIKNFCINGDESEQAVLVRELFRQAGITSLTAPFNTLIKAKIWAEEENLELLRYEINTEFSKAVVQQAEALAEFPVDAKKEAREDLTGLQTFTIDGPESQDLDDALSFRKVNNKWEIGIHITDIGLQVERNTPLFEEALQRGTTIYLPDRKISMLPEILSQKAWSLEMGSDRRALSFFIYLDPKGNILSQQIVRSVINIKERLTYETAEARITKGHLFHTLYELCVARQTRRIEDGALPLPIPELVIQVDETGEVEVELSHPGPGRFLIAECMILANLVAAQFVKNHSIPALYRSQPPPRDRIISGNETDLLANFRQRRLISKGNLGTEPDIHHGLGLDVYTTITSPLRRGLDLLMQQQITHMLAEGKPLHAKEDLIKFAIYLQQGLNTAAAVRQARVRYWLLKHMEKRKGEPLDAWILDTGRNKLLAVLSDYLLTVELPLIPGQRYSWDQLVKVQIKKVNARENILKMDWRH